MSAAAADEEIPMYNDVNVHHSSFVYGNYEKRKTKDGKPGKGASIYINESASSRRSPEVQLPKMRAPFGCRPPQDAEGNPRKDAPTWNMEVAVEDAEMLQYYDDVDEQHKSHVASINGEKHVFPGYDEAAISAFYRRTCQRSRSTTGDYAPLMRIKIHLANTEIYVVKGNEAVPGTVADITPNCEVVPAVTNSGLWFANKSFGATYPATIVYVFPTGQRKRRRVNAAAFGANKVPKIVESKDNEQYEEDDM